MNDFWLGLLSAAFATNQVVAVSNHVARATGIHLPLEAADSPVEQAFQRLLEEDQDALDQVDRWILEERRLADQGAGIGGAALNAKIEERLKPVEDAYREFIKEHPDHIRARLALGSFLHETGREAEGVAIWEDACARAPRNPAAWNNLANHYAHRGPVKRGLEYFEQAIKLNPAEPVYRRNLATVVFLFRKDAREYYGLPDDQAVLWRSLEFYEAALERAPKDFTLATEVAQVYYFLRPRGENAPEAAAKLTDQCLAAWRRARSLTDDPRAQEGVEIHMARVCHNAGRFAEARQHLDRVSDPVYATVKKALVRRLRELTAARAEGKPPRGNGGPALGMFAEERPKVPAGAPPEQSQNEPRAAGVRSAPRPGRDNLPSPMPPGRFPGGPGPFGEAPATRDR